MVAVEPLGHGGPPHSAMTDEEWANLPEDEEGELVDGVLVEEEVPDWIHETVVIWLATTLRLWAKPLGGHVGGSELKYIVRPGRGRKPDVSVILPGQKRPPGRGAIRKPADLLIEVISPTPRDARRDRMEKFNEYAAFGVRYYWLVDPMLKTFELYELNGQGRYERTGGASLGKLDNIPGCGGLVLDLDALWAELDEFHEQDSTDDSSEPA